MLRTIDLLLISLASICLFRYGLIFSEQHLTYFESFIPQLFIDSAPVTVGSTFHVFIASFVTGLFLTRYARMPILVALIAASSVIAIDLYLTEVAVKALVNSLLARPSELIEFLKPLVMLLIFTYLFGLITALSQPVENAEQEND
jgi:hypothetical protein